MNTLPLHTFHALQLLNVSYFKPFKLALKKEKNSNLVIEVTILNWTMQH